MSVFKLFFQILNKRKSAAIIWFFIFVPVLALNVITIGNENNEYESSSASIGIVTNDKSEAGKNFCDFLESRHDTTYFDKTDTDRFRTLLYYTNQVCIFEIPEDFGERLEKGEREDLFECYYIHPVYGKTLAVSDAEEFIKITSAYIDSGKSAGESTSLALEQLSKGVEARLMQKVEQTNGMEQMTFMFFLNLSFGITAIYIQALSTVYIEINNKDLSNRISSSCLSGFSKNIQLFAGSAIFVFGMWILLIIIGIIITGSGYTGIEWYYVLNAFSYTLVTTALAVFISSFGFSANIINFITNILSLGMSFLCGAFIDIEFLSESVRTIARLLPMYWYTENVYLIYDKGAITGEYYLNILIQLMFGVLFLALNAAVIACKQNGIFRKRS